jgi:hypothetical protein
MKTKKTKPAAREATHSLDPSALRDLTARIAYELFLQRGRVHGNDVQDWIDAEKIARAKLYAMPA